ncbi:hypothetical protein X777_08419 [Ooceraea biroi]|uniref:Uncharacterized protein n=1 Tax=Ooceraea biroi TaxID=2015173 RepID=A0A026WYV9_OOCBI|nr:hypothetical protein X777_08419 [Ooceraea biroi]
MPREGEERQGMARRGETKRGGVSYRGDFTVREKECGRHDATRVRGRGQQGREEQRDGGW